MKRAPRPFLCVFRVHSHIRLCRLPLPVTSLALSCIFCVWPSGGWCSNHVHVQSYSLDVVGHKIHCCGPRVEYLWSTLTGSGPKFV